MGQRVASRRTNGNTRAPTEEQIVGGQGENRLQKYFNPGHLPFKRLERLARAVAVETVFKS
jgi:hypothetical protein